MQHDDDDLDTTGLIFDDEPAPTCFICEGKKPNWIRSYSSGKVYKGLSKGLLLCTCGDEGHALNDPEFCKRSTLHSDVAPILKELRRIDAAQRKLQETYMYNIKIWQDQRDALNQKLMETHRLADLP